MGTPDKKVSELVDTVKSLIHWKREPPNVSKDFWMPDKSCSHCYACDVQFTLINRRHHCRVCGLVFCSKCAGKTISLAVDQKFKGSKEDPDRVRVCSFCFQLWHQERSKSDEGIGASSPCLSPSNSEKKLVRSPSACSCATVSSTTYSTGSYQHISYQSDVKFDQSNLMDQSFGENEESTTNLAAVDDVRDSSSDQCLDSPSR